MRDERAGLYFVREMHGRCNSLMNYPQTHQYPEGKEERRQRRKAILVGRIVKIEAGVRVEARRDSHEQAILVDPQGEGTRVPEDPHVAHKFPTQAENAINALTLRNAILLTRFCHSALNSPQLRREGGLAIIEESWETKDWDKKIRP